MPSQDRARLLPSAAVLAAALALVACRPASTFVASSPTPDGNTLPPPGDVQVTVTPHESYAVVGQALGFTASLTGPAESVAAGADWSVQEGDAGGTIGTTGAYTAPATAGTYHVVATARADPTKHDAATVFVAARATSGRPEVMPVISRGRPAYSSDSYNAASTATAGNYTNEWTSRNALPAWLAIDLSALPAGSRGAVVVAWYNSQTPWYDPSMLSGAATYSLAADYTIDAHPAAGGGAPPSPADPGWVTLATVTGNELSSRQHLVDLGGRNWIRMRVTAACPRNASSPATDIAFNLDVHDAHLGAQDDWFFVGDSITAAAWIPSGQFAQGINAALPDHFPAAQDGGTGFQTSASTAAKLGGWLAQFPGRYVALSLGTNDANTNLLGTAALDAFQANYESMVQAVISAGKVPVVPTIIWSSNAQIQANLPALNARLVALKAAHPEIVNGPDLYATFNGHTEWIADTIHPNPAGYAVLRAAWIQAMLANVYQ